MASLGPNVHAGERTNSSASAHSTNPLGKPIESGGDMFSSAASGVMSMLKTTTDTGNIGSLSFANSRLATLPRSGRQQRQNASRVSTSSLQTNTTNHSYAASQLSKRTTNMQSWDAVSAISNDTYGTRARHRPRGSVTSLQTMRTAPLSYQDVRNTSSSPYGRPQLPFDGRTYSLGQPQPRYSLKPHRSATSLRSQASGSYPSQRIPYGYQAHLRRPLYPSPSPARSDLSGPYGPGYGVPPGLNESTGLRYSQDRYKGPSHSPLYGAHMPFAPAHQPTGAHYHRQPTGSTYGRNMPGPGMQSHDSDYASLVPTLPRYDGGGVHPQGRTIHSSIVEDCDLHDARVAPLRNAPSFSVVPYDALSHIPPRTHTPQMHSLPSSSGPGSSAPPSSNPPTPRNATADQAVVNAASDDTLLGEVHDYYNEHSRFDQYMSYSEKPREIYELEAQQPAASELDVIDSVNNVGFVQRIKTLLEDRAAGQTSGEASNLKLSEHLETPTAQTAAEVVIFETPHAQQAVELPTTRSISPRSMNKHLELVAPLRITRDLIKANTALPSSSGPLTCGSPSTRESFATLQASRSGKDMISIPGDSAIVAACVEPHPEESKSAQAHNSASIMARSGAISNSISAATGTLHAAAVEPNIQIENTPAGTNRAKEDFTYPRTLHGGKTPLPIPVSPLEVGEEAVRDSAVSTIATQRGQVYAETEQQITTSSFSDESRAPSPPRSKSLPSPALSTIETISRLSIPPDLSLLNEARAASNIVTDVAVRLSVPRTIDHAKPQVVNFSTSSGFLASQPEPGAKRSGMKSLRESIFNIELVAPLQIKKTDNTTAAQNPTDSTDLSSFIRRSFPRRQSVWLNDRSDSGRLSEDSTTEIRLPMMKCTSRLSGLKEDSQEDMSIKSFRFSGFKLGPRSVIQPKAGQGSFRHSEEAPRPNHLPARPPRMTLSELRNLPSLNFSRMDLIDKLNEALEVRSSKSAEIVTRRALPGIFCPSPVRPSSTEALIERYTSFFSKPEDSDIHESMSYDSSVNELQTSEEGDVCNTIHNLGGEDASQAGCSLSPSVRPLSPEELLGIVSDANRLSVPSVTALTERLSEILPSLKRLHIDSAIADDKAIKDTISEIHRLGERFSKVERARSISLIRQKTPVSEEITYGGILRPTLSETKNNRSMKDLPSLPEGTERLDVTGALSLSESGLDKNTTLGTDHQPALATNNMPGMPRPALLRIRSLNDIDGFKDIHLGYTDSAHRRSLATLTQDSRPWNLDENYPWSANGPTIDIVFPAPVLRRNSSASTVLRGASKTSGEMMADETDEASSMAHRKSPLSRTSPLIGFDEHTGTTISTLYGRKASKTSLIGSLSRRIGLKQAKFATLSSPLSQHAVPHRTGERYPSSGLFAPTAIQLDEVRSFFSDSTAENEDKRRPLHKHITSIRSRMPGQAATSTSRLQSLEMDRSKRLHPIHSQLSMRVRTNSSRPASLFDDRVIEMDTPILYDGIVGMGRVEFRVKRVAERLKHFWVKGGEILRSLSQRGRHSGDVNMKQKQRQERQNWLADSLYSSDSAQRLGAR